jgi:hypothetical protein
MQIQQRTEHGQLPTQQSDLSSIVLPLLPTKFSGDAYWASIDIHKVMFPLPVDQRLLVLVQYNVIRAVKTNVTILSMHRLTTLNCVTCREKMPLFPSPTDVPVSLVPTALQKSSPHEPWIDLLPCPTMRDNAIKHEGKFDTLELGNDLFGGLYEGYKDPDGQRTGLLVWSDPWDVRGWELTDSFARKWDFLVKDCYQLIEATNMWRSLRNEEPLVIELS